MKRFKRIAAGLLATATMAIGIGGLSASASTASDNYSVFTWSKSGSSVSVSIKNTTKTTRMAQVNSTGYDAYGNYIGFISNEGNIGDSQTLSKSGTLSGAVSVTFSGNLYSSRTAVGTPLSHWSRSIG